jgi:co-chaperonin GroES (HSP10)
MKKVIPRGKYMLIKTDEPESKENEAGLLAPSNEEAEEKAQGTVESVGEEVKGVMKGDRVVFGVFAGEVLKLKENGKTVEYKLLHDDDVIAFIK